MTRSIDLVVLGDSPIAWAHGRVLAGGSTPSSLARCTDLSLAGDADAILWWDPVLGDPPIDPIFLDAPDDVWHAGLALGQGDRPDRLQTVAPAWMLAADPTTQREASSWRLTLRACLARRAVVEQLGGPDPAFETVAGSGLELGHRWITLGARCRHRPDLVTTTELDPDSPPTDRDGLRFIERRYGTRWAAVSALRESHRLRSLRAIRTLAAEARPVVDAFQPPSIPAPTVEPVVSVIIPTLDRYDWLATVLEQLGHQTIAPHQVLVVDQTAPERRQSISHATLPLEVLVREVPGQCSARNAALAVASGSTVLFIDDDDEIEPDLIERHAAVIEHRAVDVSSGVAHEPGDSEATSEFRRFRTADVFPTNNTMVRRETLALTGGFDLAFDHGVRADHELGTRLYREGARMVLSPDIDVVHHRAPTGGLRATDARRVTAASSRRSLISRQPLAATEIYLWRRHHPDDVRAAIALRLIGSFRGTGSVARRAVRVVAQLILLPAAIGQVRRARRQADELAAQHPTIPRLAPNP